MKLRLTVADRATDDGCDFIMFVTFDIVKNKNRAVTGREIVNSKSQLHKARMKLRDLLKMNRAEKAEKS